MKIKAWLFAILLLSLLGVNLNAEAAESYKFDSEHSYVAWYIKHFDFSTQTGKWFVEGNLILDQAKPENSTVNISIQVAKIVTGIDALNEHLSSPLFFDVKKFPMATFVSDKVEVTGKNTALVSGILTVHGVAKPITLAVTLNKLAPNPITQKMTAGFTATTKLKRSDFGVSAYLPGLGDEVDITIGAEANKV